MRQSPPLRSWLTLATAALLLSVAVPTSTADQPTNCIVVTLSYVAHGFDVVTDVWGGSVFVAFTAGDEAQGATVGAVVTPLLCKLEVQPIALGQSMPQSPLPWTSGLPSIP